jgi:hypothetical protein
MTHTPDLPPRRPPPARPLAWVHERCEAMVALRMPSSYVALRVPIGLEPGLGWQ